MGLPMHGNLPREDDEEGPVYRGEELQLEQAPLSLAVHRCCAVPTLLMAR